MADVAFPNNMTGAGSGKPSEALKPQLLCPRNYVYIEFPELTQQAVKLGVL